MLSLPPLPARSRREVGTPRRTELSRPSTSAILIVGHVRETVAAEQKPVAVDELHRSITARTPSGPAERARENVAEPMAGDVLLADQPLSASIWAWV